MDPLEAAGLNMFALNTFNDREVLFAVAYKLQQRADSMNCESPPVVYVNISTYVRSISIGDFVVWNSETDSSDIATEQECWESYIHQLRQLLPPEAAVHLPYGAPEPHEQEIEDAEAS